MSKRQLVIAALVIAVLGAAFLGYALVLRETPVPGGAAADSAASSIAEAQRPPEDRRALRLARRLITQTDSAFQAVEPLTAAEKSRLRRYLQPQHIVRARRLGLDPVRNRTAAADLADGSAEASAQENGAVRIHTNDFYILDPAMSYGVPLVVPSTKHLLERLGRNFQRALLERGLPPYRFLLTSVLRTGQDQAALSGVNVNAAQGQSTHEYGTTFDIYYEWFHYAAVHDARTQRTLPQADSARAGFNEALLRERLYEAYTRFGGERAVKIKAVLGRTILEMQNEGRLLATYERRQPVFHLTVAEEVEAPSGDFAPRPAPDSARTAATALPAPAN